MSNRWRQTRGNWRAPLYWPGYYLYLAIFGTGAGIANAAVSLSARLGRPANPPALRARIQRLLASYLKYQRPFCRLDVRFTDWPIDWEQQITRTVLIANHQSLLDAPMLLARSPRLVCLYKAALGRTLLWQTMADRAGYLSNEGGIDTVRAAVSELESGGTLLLFPEGTRSRSGGLGTFESGGALIAIRAGAPVQMVLIEMTSPILTKGRSNLRPPRLPATATLRWGPRLEAQQGESFRDFTTRLETTMRSVLTSSE